MEDPEGGAKPQFDGASAAGRKDGKKSRRRKGKRGGQSRNAAHPASHEPSGGAGQPARPIEDAAGNPARKRKRRRRGGHGVVQDGSPLPQVMEQTAAAGDAVRADSDSAPSRRNRRKHRGKRGLQGRPLTPAKPSGAPQQESRSDETVLRAELRETLNGASANRRGRPESHSHSGHQGDRPAGEHAWPEELYAALDLGTNNCRLLIAQPTRPGQFRVVDAFSRIVRLGEGLAASGRLSDEAMERAIEALRICASKLRNRQIRRMRLIATEACRQAVNGEDFLSRVVAETGLELEIIDRETEARLAVSGCSSLVGRETRSVVLFDIGGGSSEIAVIRIGDNRFSRLANHITHWTSLPVGVVTLSERHGGHDVTPEAFEGMVREVEGMLGSFDCPEIEVAQTGDFHLIGTSGTVTTLAGVHLDLPRYDRRKVDGIWLSDDEVSAMQAKLLSWDFASRAANPCIGPDRADLVLAGCAILEAIRRRWPSPRMRVADRGLREGLLTDMMADDGVWRRNRNRRGQRVRS
ncbi:Ppx/GppA phosphatase family protein [Rhizobium ruizarguesonis]|uniref:Ppx/GppA family phosphatase n=1 Tax=Rhizobium ruizarguesonis TaxID=2081791 RepID=A0AAE8U186_9HYPH|nr:Ppx/GppA phosphatase family protein [Rhizobium ruizarguesonis]TAV04261.1 Ppx/GppA family phosphatase [Rhizobium ruizarguesonis]TBA79202.1 Ppx/GppA family phosphatase [Rhizobium ruizarguesonis]TBA83981.1 Ppx/GppA family phosphatase [Rhizobium ruizarguesonis]TBB10106.1 Ppx/GppA family phosphatase [Rhizobium ruizarguesonis]TBB20786.1 Ppx/GppA family phosphatase [Rhizobium ruizarguesonis]